MVAFDFVLQLRVRNVGFAANRSGIRASVQRRIEGGEGFVEVSQTETVYNENNVTFRHRCLLPYRFGRQAQYQIAVYGVRDESGVFSGCLGRVSFDLASVVSSSGKQSFPLSPNCFLDLTVSLSENYRQGVVLQLRGCQLKGPHSFPLASYIGVILCTGDRTFLLHKSEVIRGEKDPQWAAFILPLHLIQFFPNTMIQVHCYNYNPNTADSLIGYFSTTLSQLQTGTGQHYSLLTLEGQRLHEKTKITLEKFEACAVPDLLQLCQNNTHVGVCVAVDLTASNGKPDDPRSLHYVHPHSVSPYEHSMLQILPQVVPLMSQPKIIALGFGAKTEPDYELSQCFSLSGVGQNAFVSCINGLIHAYRSAKMLVKPFAPTDFSEVIYHVSKFAKAESRSPHGLYFLLFILTDGGLANPKRTIDAIVDASPHPMSIVAVGIGEGRDFTNVRALESPFLKHSDGRQLSRQTFLFTEASRAMADDTIPLLPAQMCHWAANNGRK